MDIKRAEVCDHCGLDETSDCDESQTGHAVGGWPQ